MEYVPELNTSLSKRSVQPKKVIVFSTELLPERSMRERQLISTNIQRRFYNFPEELYEIRY